MEKKISEKVGGHLSLSQWLNIGVLFCLFAGGACLGSYSYRISHQSHGNSRETILPEFKPAVLFAAGHGMIAARDFDCPALDAFLASESPCFNPEMLPGQISGPHIFFNIQSGFAQSHWILFYCLGWCWRLFGISHGVLHYLAILFSPLLKDTRRDLIGFAVISRRQHQPRQ